MLMRLAVLNELRLAIGSFAPCEVVMEGCTRVLPLVALEAGRVASPSALAGKGDAGGGSDEEGGRRPGVSPNRHPDARVGAANLKVETRLESNMILAPSCVVAEPPSLVGCCSATDEFLLTFFSVRCASEAGYGRAFS